MSKTAILIDVKNMTHKEVEFDNLEDLYKMIDCRSVDVVRAKVKGSIVDIIVDDEGLLKVDECTTSSAISMEPFEVLVGNIVITGINVKKGERRSLTKKEKRNVLNAISYRFQCELDECQQIPFLIYEKV